MNKFALLFFLAFIGTAHAQSGDIAFFPLSSTTTAIAATITASTAILLPTSESPVWSEQVVNTGLTTVYVAFGGSAIAATTSSIPILSGSVRTFTLNEGQSYVSAVTSTSTGSVSFIGGRGR